MPVRTTYPGVYIEELPSGVRTITGVATSIAAFVGYTSRGLDHKAEHVLSFADFERKFGGLAKDSPVSYAVQHFFDNGGAEGWVVRVPKNGAIVAKVNVEDAISGTSNVVLNLDGLSAGTIGNHTIVDIDYDGIPTSDAKRFNLTISNTKSDEVETFRRVSIDKTDVTYVKLAINDPDTGSRLVSVDVQGATPKRPVQSGTVGGDIDLGGAPFDLTSGVSDKNYNIKLNISFPSSSLSAISNLKAVVIKKGDPLPKSIISLCQAFASASNEALASTHQGARVRCVPNFSGKGLRIYADFDQVEYPDTYDAAITPVAGDSGGDDASLLAAIKFDNATLTSDPTLLGVNVGHYALGASGSEGGQVNVQVGTDGSGLPTPEQIIGKEIDVSGIYALDKVDIFNILCIPDATRALAGTSDQPEFSDSQINNIYSKAMAYCLKWRAMLIVDPAPNVDDLDSATAWISTRLTAVDKNGAAYFPRLRMADPLNEFKLRTFAPCGVIAGLYARTDAERGVWKAPAGTEARLVGVSAPVYKLTDEENGVLNPLGLNCFRNFPIYRNVAWGARTLLGADAQASEWKYISVRRLALFIEESLYRGTQWVVFEPNDEPLWAQIRLNVGAFMHNLFRQGAFQGSTPREAYLVKCDKETTTQNDIDLGIVNILVGFAPLKPAEFVIIKIQQLAGQVEV